jgi:hypothetical protein
LVRRLLTTGLLAALWGCTRQDPPGALEPAPPPTAVEVMARPQGDAGAAGPSAPSGAASGAPPASSAGAGQGDDDDAADTDGGAPGGDAGPGELVLAPDQEPTEGGEHKMAAIATQAWIYAGPNDETQKLGYVHAGSLIDRGERSVGVTKRCKGGWYRVFPRGYSCNGKRSTIDLAHPVAVAEWKPAARGEPLPYKYAKSKEVPPYLYHRVPTIREMERAELIKYREHMAAYPKSRFKALVGDPEPLPPFLSGGKSLPTPFGVTQRLHIGPHAGKASNGSAFAFMSVHEIEGRLFGLSTDLNLIALDRVNLAKLTEIHGGEIKDLPAGIVAWGGASKFRMDERNNPHEDGKLERFQTVSFTGKTRGELWETYEGYWVSTQGMKLIKKRESLPSFLKPDSQTKWIDISIQHQLLVAYEGARAVYVTQVSTGLAEMADPEKTTATKRGTFSIKSKHMTALMSGEQVGDDYELADVPYVQYFEGNYALHAAFWHERFGHARSHGCVNLPPQDAAWLFEWTDPPVPKGWHGVQANGAGSIVHVRY